jgi:uncharacterized protein YeaO (DUF488 family)
MIRLKRIYEKSSAEDGVRILVDRLWPRGISKEKAQMDLWLKDVAPNPKLRRWFGHNPEKFPEFKKQYEEELAADLQHLDCINQLLEIAAQNDLTLLFAAKDPVHNNAIVLYNWMLGLLRE